MDRDALWIVPLVMVCGLLAYLILMAGLAAVGAVLAGAAEAGRVFWAIIGAPLRR